MDINVGVTSIGAVKDPLVHKVHFNNVFKQKNVALACQLTFQKFSQFKSIFYFFC